MMRSWARATSAPMAIFHSKRMVMYSVTRTRNTIRPMSIFREMVFPNVGPTSCSLISLGEILAAPASAARSWSPLSVPGSCDPDAVGVGEAMADGLVLGVADAPAVGVADAPAVGVADAVGLTVGVSPSSVRLL